MSFSFMSCFTGDVDDFPLAKLYRMEQFRTRKLLFECIFVCAGFFCSSGASISISGLIMRPRRARMSDSLLETLVFLKFNKTI